MHLHVASLPPASTHSPRPRHVPGPGLSGWTGDPGHGYWQKAPAWVGSHWQNDS